MEVASLKTLVPPNEPVSLTNRTHAAGVHQGAVLRNTAAYEAHPLDLFGVNESEILLGPLSGWNIIHYFLKEIRYFQLDGQTCVLEDYLEIRPENRERLAAAVEAAHEAGVIHRDLKSSNILLDLSNHTYLADFGLARFLSTSTLAFHTGHGTPPYAPPEQVQSKEITLQSDIFSFGILLFEMFTGQLPFKGAVRVSVRLDAHCQAGFKPGQFLLRHRFQQLHFGGNPKLAPATANAWAAQVQVHGTVSIK